VPACDRGQFLGTKVVELGDESVEFLAIIRRWRVNATFRQPPPEDR